MKDLEKALMSDKEKKPKSEMSKQDVQAKMDVLMEMLEMLHSDMGGSVKSGMDELSKPAPADDIESGIHETGDLDVVEDAVEADKEPQLESAKPESAALADANEIPAPEEEDSLFGKKKGKKAFSMFED